MMKRSRAFVLVELLTTMLLQAGFILVMCTSFYMLASFYSKTQQLLTAKDHADRVILFFEDKIIHAGLGLWRCQNSSEVRGTLDAFTADSRLLRDICLPVAITSAAFDNDTSNRNNLCQTHTQNGHVIHYGSCVTLLYAERDLSSGTGANILITQNSALINSDDITLLTGDNASDFFPTNTTNTTLSNWAVVEGAGVPFCIRDSNSLVQGWGIANNQRIPAGGELLYLKCTQMFTQDVTDAGRQFAFREPNSNTGWGNTYNQEEGVLEIYMELDTRTNIFTLWVMGTGGVDYTINTSRPATWPENAHPTPSEWASTTNSTYKDYKHNIVYVSRASWKLNNIPNGFKW